MKSTTKQTVASGSRVNVARLSPLAACIAVAIAQAGVSAAYADSGNGVDTSLGNALNPAGTSSAPKEKDPDGLGQGDRSRTPTGFLNAEPNALREPTKTASGWQYLGSVEAGGILVGGDKSAAKFREYKDVRSGASLNAFGLQAEKLDSAYYVDLVAGGVGRDDQYYGATFGTYNAWRVRAFYTESPHVFTSTYRNLWNGTGTGNLTLATLKPGGTTDAATTDINIGNAALATPYSDLSIIRKKGGVRADVTLLPQWKVFAAYSGEKREGARPYGLVMGGGGGTGGVEVPESINYNTHDFLVGLNYADKRSSFNLTGSASYFRNNIDTMTVESPIFMAAANGVASYPRARFDLYPNNDFYNVKGEFARAFPEFYKARFTGVVSMSSSRQNDNLIPYTTYSGVSINGVAGSSWDTIASLSKKSADARLDTRLLDFSFAVTPLDALDVRAKFRHYETDNSAEYWACNPLTGEWGRVINDGSGAQLASANATAGVNPAGTTVNSYNSALCNLAAVRAKGLVPGSGNAIIRNIPWQQKQTNYSLSGDYRFNRANSLAFAWDYEEIDRDHRERATTWEDRLKLTYVNRSFTGSTIRLSAETDRRRGTAYVADPYDEFYSASMGPAPTTTGVNVTSWIHINDLHRKFDLADRDQNILNLRANYAFSAELDASLTAQVREAKYPSSDYGRNGRQTQNSVNLDVNWMPMTGLTLYGFYSYHDDTMAQRGVQQNACVIGTTYYFFSDGSVGTTATRTPAQVAAGITVVGQTAVSGTNWASVCGTASATSPLYPTSRSWTVRQNNENNTLGLGAKYDFTKAKLDANYSYTKGRTSSRYTYNAAALGLVTSGAATAAQTTTLGLIGDGFADSNYRQHVLDASLLVPINKQFSVRLLGRLEIGKIFDYHYDGVAANPTPAANQQTYLDSGPQNYKAHFVGVLFKYDF